MALQNNYLQVVNASAGSGKTFSLVKTYIQLLLSEEGEMSDKKYAEILAMTFTNKAALEMKTRIVKALDELAFPEGSTYIQTISDETGLKPEVIQVKAKKLLSGILHHYEDFHVMTIDKFNLRLIRSFSRDLDLPPDFEVVLNETLIIEQVVDGIINKIGSDPVISKLLLKYAQTNLEEENSWNLRKQLINFAKILSMEQDLPYVERLMNMEFSQEDFDQHRRRLRQLNEEYQARFVKLVTFFNAQNFIDKDFLNGRNIINAMAKFGNSSKRLSDDFPLSSTNFKNIQKAAEGKGGVFAELNDLALNLAAWYDVNVVEYLVIQQYLKNYFNMQLLQYLNQDLTELNKRERLIRISEFNTKISDLLKDDTLYIYEKLGTRFRNFMLDEFQDTSRLQWLNLIPLIRESLGHGNKNFIVGDPKQAIYRFKNGVAEQFVELPGIYNPENDAQIAAASEYFKQMGVVDSLEDNWRSARDVVEFNNAFFEQLKHQLSDYQRSFYASVSQNPKSSKRGYVYIESKKRDKTEDELQPIDMQLAFVRKSIQDALADGYNLGDICVLGRRNSTCTFIANKLSEDGMSVVSSDSLNIDSELTIRFVLSYLKLRLNSSNQNTIKQFFYHYCLLFEHDLAYYDSLFEVVQLDEKKHFKTAKIDLFLSINESLVGKLFAPFESLYDLIEKTFAMFKLNELKNPYLHHFADLVHLFESKNGPDLKLFIQNYATLSKDAKALQVPESDQAIKVMTIHKSKGLEFPIVITINETPAAAHKDEFFVETNDYLIRTKISKKSMIDEVRELEEVESEKAYLDLLNMYYVAYTRPVNRLYICNYFDRTTILTDFDAVLQTFEGIEINGGTSILKLGEKVPKVQTNDKKESAYFEPESSVDNLWFPDIALQDDDELHSETFLTDEQRYGNQFHLAISTISKQSEIEDVLEKLVLSGEIEHEFKAQLKQDLDQLFSTSAYNDLFEGALSVLNEQNYLVSKNELIRPDKIIFKADKTVVLDYKTGQPLKKHIKQLELYRSVLREMNYPNVEAHLFYTKNFELVTI